MSTCFLIQAHGQPELFRRLLHRLDVPGASVVAHIDAKQEQSQFMHDSPANVTFLEDRIKVNWGGVSLYKAMLLLLREAVALHPESDHYVFLSGQDYPVYSVANYVDFLAEHPDKSWVNFYPMHPRAQFYDVISRYWFDDFVAEYPKVGKYIVEKFYKFQSRRLPKRKPLKDFQFYRGSSSWCVSRKGALAALAFLDSRNGKKLTRYLETCHVTDEIWMATALLNASDRGEVANWDTDGKRAPGEMLEENKVYHHYIDWSPERENPALLTLADLPKIDASKKWFIRKVDSVKSAELLDELDARDK
ncbi:beta-1,6-N-acetylglucosaminyltransferase [Dermabacteraceae bacterium P7054]